MYEHTSQAFHLQSNATGSQWLCVLTFFCCCSQIIVIYLFLFVEWYKKLIIMRPCLFNTCFFAVVKKCSANTMKPLRGLFTYK